MSENADVQPEPAPAGGDVLMPPETLMERIKADGRLWKAGVAAGRQDAPAGGTIDRDALRSRLASVLASVMNYPKPARVHLLGQDLSEVIDRATDAVLAVVRPVAIDPDAALAFITRLGYGDRSVYDVDAILGELSALVRPVKGVVLTPENLGLVVFALRQLDTAGTVTARGEEIAVGERAVNLAERLEASL